jgi:subtilase family serine protease
MRPLHRLFPCLAILSFLTGTSAIAQRVPSTARIVEKVDDNQLVTLRGNTHPAANALSDQGRVSSRLRMSDLVLVLKRSPERQAAFDALVADQYDSTSPNFHRWLEPSEIGAQFGPSQADIATISSWLTGRGFSVDEVSKDRMTIRFSGTAGQVERAFHTEIHNLSVKGEAHMGNMSDPQIPMALDPVVAGVKALHNFFPRPLHKLGGKATLNPETGRWQNAANAAPVTGKGLSADAIGIHPNLGINVPNNGNPYLVEDVTPYDFAAIYNVAPLWSGATPIDGTGQTIAIVGTSKIRTTDVAAFRSTFGLPAGPAVQMTVANGTDPGICTSTANPSAANNYCTIDDQTENALDVEWSGAVAKNAQIVLVVSGANSTTTDTVYSSANYIVQNSTAPIMNVSYGECELGLGTAGNTLYNNLWKTAAAAGISVFVATGDSGSPACDQGQATTTPYGAQFGLSVSGLASTQYNTAVGGTDLNWGSTAAPYWNSTNSSANGSNALGYMPEIPWDDSCTNPEALSYFAQWAQAIRKNGLGNPADPTDAETACNFVVNWWQTIYSATAPNNVNLSSFVNTVGAGGGKSNCINGDQSTVASCTQGYPKPTWQAGVTGIPGDSARDIPDVSFFASNGFLGSAYLICVTDNGACVTSTSPTAEPTAQEIGGTSAASPAMAGVMALINQKAGSAQGNPNAELYALAAKQSYSSCKSETGTTSNGCYFNDVVTGTITMACQQGATNCTVAHSGDTWGLLNGYNATVGFDLATGLGTLNVANVVNGWTASTGTAAATVTVTPAQSSIVSNVALIVTGTVAGASGTPTGTVVLTGGGYTSSAATLTSGAFSITIPANSLNAGTDTLNAKYSGDPTYAPATGTANVTVTAAPKPTVTVTPASSSINSGQSLAVTVALAGGIGTPTGTVTLSSGSYTSAATAVTSGSAAITIPPNSLSAGADTLTASYGGDSTYGTAAGTGTVTVTQSTFSLSASAPASVNRGSSAISTITVNTSNSYSGTVRLSCALTSGPTNAAGDAPTCTASTGAVSPGATGTASVTTKAATTSALELPLVPGKGRGLLDGGAVLALVVLLGIPARRRSWRAMLGVLVLMIALGSLAACGGGGSDNSGGTKDPGTASGTYTFTVTGTGSPAQSTGNTATFTVNVN